MFINFNGIGNEFNAKFHRPEFAYQRTMAAPQVKPPPIASINIRSPFLMRPSVMATSRAKGIDAAEVLA